MVDLPLGPPAGDARRVRFRGGGFLPRSRAAISVAGIAALVALWELASARAWVDPLFLPGPRAIGRALGDLAASGALWAHLSASLFRIGLGWAIGAAAGLALGLLIGLFTTMRSIGLPLVSALFPIPKIAILPLLILWLGIGEPSKVATIAAGVLFPVAIATAAGLDAVPRNLIRMAQSFGVPFHAIVLKVMLPGALPGILSGLRISASIALILVVAAEMIGARTGIGTLVLQAGNLMNVEQLMAGVVVLSALGLGVGAVLSGVERWLLRWR